MLFMGKSTISTGPWLPVGYVNVHPPGPGAPQEAQASNSFHLAFARHVGNFWFDEVSQHV